MTMEVAMFCEIKTIKTKRDLYGRLYATVIGEDDSVVAEYRTNNKGSGLWIRHHPLGDWKQILGTCQFSVRDRAAFRRKLRRGF